MIRAQVIGLSHTNALRGALKKRPSDFQQQIDITHMLLAVPDKSFVHVTSNGIRLNPALSGRLAQADDATRKVFSQVGGNAHNFMGLFRHPSPYDFILPEQPDLSLECEAEIVPYEYVGEVLKNYADMDFNVLGALRSTVQAQVYHLESPPPVRDNDFCKENLPPVFLNQKEEIASPMFRYKLWRLHSHMLRRECERIGVDFIPCPSASMDADGFLRREYYIDPLHGNEAYGDLVLDQIVSILDDEPTGVHK